MKSKIAVGLAVGLVLVASSFVVADWYTQPFGVDTYQPAAKPKFGWVLSVDSATGLVAVQEGSPGKWVTWQKPIQAMVPAEMERVGTYVVVSQNPVWVWSIRRICDDLFEVVEESYLQGVLVVRACKNPKLAAAIVKAHDFGLSVHGDFGSGYDVQHRAGGNGGYLKLDTDQGDWTDGELTRFVEESLAAIRDFDAAQSDD